MFAFFTLSYFISFLDVELQVQIRSDMMPSLRLLVSFISDGCAMIGFVSQSDIDKKLFKSHSIVAHPHLLQTNHIPIFRYLFINRSTNRTMKVVNVCRGLERTFSYQVTTERQHRTPEHIASLVAYENFDSDVNFEM